MGTVTISWELMLGLAGLAGGLVSFIWHVAMYIGRLSVRVTLHDGKFREHETRFDVQELRIGDHDKELEYLKGIKR